ncbi:MAG: GntR family transcriptional regulator [Candidatus Acidiferrales bacterium]
MKVLTRIPMISERVIVEIRGAILEGALLSGSRIYQEKIASTLGVSREPIRKALLRLETEGLVKVVNGGAIVAPIDHFMIVEIYEFREFIEGYVAAKVAERKDFDPTTLQRILNKGRESVAARSVDRLIELDQAFHRELYRASENRVVMDVMGKQWSHIYRAMKMDLSMDSFRKQSWNEHAGIVAAILKGQVSLAKTLASAHIRAALNRKQTRVAVNADV